MPEYISVGEASAKFNVSERRVQILCEQGRIDGAKILSGVWLIPETSPKPIDARTKAARNYDQLSLFDSPYLLKDSITLEEVCKLLSISLASGRNWVRLGKIKPLPHISRPLLFSKKEIEQLIERIYNSDTRVLKSRRNKKKVSGIKLYVDYVKSSATVETVGELLRLLPHNLDERYIRIVLANTALQLSSELTNLQLSQETVAIQEYFSNGLSFGLPSFLINDILGDSAEALSLLPDLIDALKVRFRNSDEDDILGFVYMSIKSMGSKKSSGAYYTPATTVNKLLENLKKTTDLSSKSCLDPCCGSGNFLLSYARMVNSHENIYGQDNDELAVVLARTNFALRHGIYNKKFLYEHFTVGNSLLSLPNRQYDIIIGNPPWGYEFSKEMVSILCQRYKSVTVNCIESYDLFVEQAIRLLPENGIMSFILPEAILNVKTHESIRRIMIEKGTFTFVSYIGNAFSGVQCPAIILGVKKGKTQQDIKVCCEDQEYLVSGKQIFTANNINLRSSNKERDCLEAIANITDKEFLRGKATFALGIVTGNNKQMVLGSQEADCEIVLKGSDIRRFTWASGGHYIRFDPKQFQQVAPTEYYRAPEKLLYRFICDKPVFAYDDKQTLSLNSCNILIPQIRGLSVKYILAILNSRVADFYCCHKFNSVKLLRSHIEEIPVPLPSESCQQRMVSSVDAILTGKVPVNEIYEDIDATIMDLYGLSSAHKEVVRSHCVGKNMFLV